MNKMHRKLIKKSQDYLDFRKKLCDCNSCIY